MKRWAGLIPHDLTSDGEIGRAAALARGVEYCPHDHEGIVPQQYSLFSNRLIRALTLNPSPRVEEGL